MARLEGALCALDAAQRQVPRPRLKYEPAQQVRRLGAHVDVEGVCGDAVRRRHHDHSGVGFRG